MINNELHRLWQIADALVKYRKRRKNE